MELGVISALVARFQGSRKGHGVETGAMRPTAAQRSVAELGADLCVWSAGVSLRLWHGPSPGRSRASSSSS
eukprot:s278_g24.t1